MTHLNVTLNKIIGKLFDTENQLINTNWNTEKLILKFWKNTIYADLSFHKSKKVTTYEGTYENPAYMVSDCQSDNDIVKGVANTDTRSNSLYYVFLIICFLWILIGWKYPARSLNGTE